MRTDTEKKLKRRSDNHYKNMVLSGYQQAGMDKEEIDSRMKELNKRLKRR
mgnify:CR=1 FL=1